MTAFNSGSCLNALFLPHPDKYPRHFKTVEAFSTGFWTQCLKKAAPKQSWANSGCQQGALQAQRIIRKRSVPYFTGLLQLAAEFLDPKVRSRWRARIRTWSLHEQFTHFNWMCLLSFRDGTKFSFLSSLTVNTRPEYLLEFRHYRGPLDLFFQMLVVTKKAWQWLVATSNSKPVKDAGMTRMLKMTSTLLYLHF